MKLLKKVEIIEKKSRFLGYFYQINNENDVKEIVQQLKKEHPKATHICYAARAKNPFYERAVDDGEPGGTAGRPILSVLQKREINDAGIFVVRYFGGVKLGAGGLVRIYSKTACLACDLTEGE